MIPVFPSTKRLELADKQEVEKITYQFEPYSDFNFVSMWSWDVDEDTEISILNDNLAVKFRDYISGDQSWSFIGNSKLAESAKLLLGYSEGLKLIPEFMAKELSADSGLKVWEDDDNKDYILGVENLISLSGNKFGPKRNFVNRFKRLYGDKVTVKSFDLSEQKNKDQVLRNFDDWRVKSRKSEEETEREFRAVRKLLTGAGSLKLSAMGLFLTGELKAFSIDEVVQSGYAMIHYEKADPELEGIFAFLKQQSALEMNKLGCKYINYEQDLGLTGLRKAKTAWNPVNFLKKYVISRSTI
jgi:uncharacterized protein